MHGCHEGVTAGLNDRPYENKDKEDPVESSLVYMRRSGRLELERAIGSFAE